MGFEQLLELFWSSHRPSRDGRRSQYRAILLCENDTQLEMGLASARRIEERTGEVVRTEIVKRNFHPAEAYHQKWKLRQRSELMADLSRNYEDEPSLLRSVAATKLNAYVGGHGTAAQLERDIARLGLSGSGMEQLRAFAPSGRKEMR